MKTYRSSKPFVAIFAGLIACGVHFTLMYAIATLACLRPQSIEPAFNIRYASAAMTAIVLGALAVFFVNRHRAASDFTTPDNDPSRFLNFVALALGLLAVVAILWVILSALLIADCRT